MISIFQWEKAKNLNETEIYVNIGFYINDCFGSSCPFNMNSLMVTIPVPFLFKNVKITSSKGADVINFTKSLCTLRTILETYF